MDRGTRCGDASSIARHDGVDPVVVDVAVKDLGPWAGAGEADGVLFIAMRFVNGGDLRHVLEREGALTSARTAEAAFALMASGRALPRLLRRLLR